MERFTPHKTLSALAVLALLCASAASVLAHGASGPAARYFGHLSPRWPVAQDSFRAEAHEAQDWRRGYTMIVMSNTDVAAANRARDFVIGEGGRVAVLMPPHVMFGWIPPGLAQKLVGRHGIERVVYEPLDPSALKYKDERTVAAVSSFNFVVGGLPESEPSPLQRREPPKPLTGDALPRPELDYESYLQNLKAAGVSEEAAQVLPGNSDSMTGTVAAVLFFVESNGTIDSNSYSWSPAHQQDTINRAVSGLAWWSARAGTYGKSVTFSLYFYSATEASMRQGYEPILHSSIQDSLWINAIMANLGYTSGDHHSRVTAFNTYMKGYAQTDSAYSVFVGYNPSPAPDAFTNGYFAYAYLGGPYTHLLYRNDGWGEANFGLVLAHETGHIFWACDEYYQPGYGGCQSCAACAPNGPRPTALNGNCSFCNPGAVSCIMFNSSSDSLCNFTVEQIGWGSSSGGAKPNLTPYQPANWSDKIVVSSVTGTNTDAATLLPTDSLYVDWAAINNGNQSVSSSFHVSLYVDSTLRTSWQFSPPLDPNWYAYVSDYSLGSLPAGQHILKLVVDSGTTIAESNETDNEYTKVINVVSPQKPNLTPYQPPGWSDKIVVSKTTGTNTDSATLSPTDSLYVDWAELNNGTAATSADFFISLYVDGVERGSWYTTPPFGANSYAFVSDYHIGTLAAGQHTIRIVLDTTNTIAEGNEADNEYVKTITVTGGGGGSGGLQYYPLPNPVRLLDTRAGQAACYNPGAPLAGGSVRTQPARGTCGGATIPAAARAVVGNATVVNNRAGSGPGYVTLYTSGVARPTVSNINYTAGQVLSNAFTVGLGSDGALNVYAHSTTDFILDVTGYYAPPGAGGLYFHPLPSPVRLLDTRIGQTACDAPGAPVPAGGVRTELARLSCAGVTIPADALAVVGNATVVNDVSGGGPGFITLYTSGAPRPTVSNINYVAGQVLSNAFTVGLGSDGSFGIYAHSTVNVIVDVIGYYGPGAGADVNGVGGLLYNPLPTPFRLLDTRAGEPACYNPGAPLAGGSAWAQLARVTCGGATVPSAAQAVVGNATIVNTLAGSGFGYVTLYPSGRPRPLVSNINYGPGQVLSNAFTVGLGSDGGFRVYPFTTTHFISDVTGYFAPSGP